MDVGRFCQRNPGMVMARHAFVHADPGCPGILGQKHAVARGPGRSHEGELQVVGLVFVHELVIHDVAAACQDDRLRRYLVDSAVGPHGREPDCAAVLDVESGHGSLGDDLDAQLGGDVMRDDLHGELAADLEVAGGEQRHGRLSHGAEGHADAEHLVHGAAGRFQYRADERHVGIVVGVVFGLHAPGVYLQAVLDGAVRLGHQVEAPCTLQLRFLRVDAAAGDGRAAAGVAHALADDDALPLFGCSPGGHEAGGPGTHDGDVGALLHRPGRRRGGRVAGEVVRVPAGCNDGVDDGVLDGHAGDGRAGDSIGVHALALDDALRHLLDRVFAHHPALVVVEDRHRGDRAALDDGLHVDGAVHARSVRDVGPVGEHVGHGLLFGRVPFAFLGRGGRAARKPCPGSGQRRRSRCEDEPAPAQIR